MRLDLDKYFQSNKIILDQKIDVDLMDDTDLPIRLILQYKAFTYHKRTELFDLELVSVLNGIIASFCRKHLKSEVILDASMAPEFAIDLEASSKSDEFLRYSQADKSIEQEVIDSVKSIIPSARILSITGKTLRQKWDVYKSCNTVISLGVGTIQFFPMIANDALKQIWYLQPPLPPYGCGIWPTAWNTRMLPLEIIKCPQALAKDAIGRLDSIDTHRWQNSVTESIDKSVSEGRSMLS